MTRAEVDLHFAFAHLPPELRAVSAPFAEVAEHMMTLPRCGQRHIGLQRLLEAKDCAVRAALSPQLAEGT